MRIHRSAKCICEAKNQETTDRVENGEGLNQLKNDVAVIGSEQQHLLPISMKDLKKMAQSTAKPPTTLTTNDIKIPDAKWVRTVKEFYENAGFCLDGPKNGITEVEDPTKLPAGARKTFDELDKDWGPDYPPRAYQSNVEGKLTYAIVDANDGGFFFYTFDKNGTLIASGGAGESTEYRWD